MLANKVSLHYICFLFYEHVHSFFAFLSWHVSKCEKAFCLMHEGGRIEMNEYNYIVPKKSLYNASTKFVLSTLTTLF